MGLRIYHRSMNQGKYVLAQLMSLFSRYEFNKCVDRYQGNRGVRSFSCWQQFLCLVFGQLTHRESLRDIIVCLEAQEKKLYHLGLSSKVTRSTFSDANQTRNWRIYADFAEVLIKQLIQLPRHDQEELAHIPHSIYALDASLIRICLNVFFWAKYRRTKAAVKIHTLLDVRTMFPQVFMVTEGIVHDQYALKDLSIQLGAFYVMERGYMNLKELFRIHQHGAFFVIRAKKDFRFVRYRSRPKAAESTIDYDQEGKFEVYASRKIYPEKIRAIKSTDSETGQAVVLITNHMHLPASDIALIYRYRWRIELFFKWIKQHLRIKIFWGESENAVRTQLYTALCAYLIVAIARQKLQSTHTLNEITQILSVSLFDKTPINQLLTKEATHNSKNDPDNQLTIW